MEIVETPGHTPGTISLIFPAYDHGRAHKAVLWGGTGFNFGPLADRYRSYAQSAEAMKHEVLREKIDVFLSNHVKRDYADRKLDEMAKGARVNPLVLTPARTAQAFETLGQCALHQLDSIK